MLDPVFPNSIDSTMLSAYTDCPQKFFIEYCLRLSPQGRSPDLHGGGAVAAGMEATRKAFFHDGKSMEESVGVGLEAFTIYWGDFEPPEKHNKTYINMAHAFTEYWIKWNLETDDLTPLDLPGEASSIEFTFALPTRVTHPITGDPILYSGRCDLAATRGGIVQVVDEKTTKSLGSSFARKWGMRGQFMGYCFALNTLGMQCEHALIRALCIQVTDLKLEEILVPVPYYKQQRWWNASQNKIEEIVGRWHWMLERREQIAKQNPTLGRIELNQLQNEASHGIWTYAFAEACEQYGGCSFKTLCSRQHPELHYGGYDTRIWDPLAKDPTAGSTSSMEEMESTSLPPEGMALIGKV